MSTLKARRAALRARSRLPYAVTFTLVSRNSKVGPIPVSTTSRGTCPPDCGLFDICYAASGPLGGLWKGLSATKPGGTFVNGRGIVQTYTWQSFCSQVAALPPATLWRHNQAGDLPGNGNTIDPVAMRDLIEANRGRRGFTYTHKPLSAANLALIRFANHNGFTVNLSADSLADADRLAETGLPVVVVLPDTVQGNEHIATPAGRRVAVCPATYMADVNCASCQLCQRQGRKVIVGFPAHGSNRRKVSIVARGGVS